MTVVIGLLVNSQLLVDGAVTGLTYGLLAVGLVLIYRSSGIINFAYAEVGAFSASLLALAVLEWHWPFAAAALLAVVAGAALSAVIELTVIRRLFDAPRVIVLIATVGVAELVLVLRMVLPKVRGFHRFPAAFEGRWDLGSFTLRSDQLVVCIAVPVLTLSLTWFLSRTRTGTAIRGAASNAEACRLMGINVRTLSTLVWLIAGGLSAVAAMVVRPLEGMPVTAGAGSLDARLLTVALAAALVARMRSMPIAIAAGVVLGVIERLILVNMPGTPGAMSGLVLAVVLVAALWSTGIGDGRATRWSFASARTALDDRVRSMWIGRNLDRLGLLVLAIVAFVLPLLVTKPSRHQLFAQVAVFALVALSVTVLTGWAGQLSLGQFAFAGLGAFTTAALMSKGLGFAVSAVLAALVGLVAAVIVGLPALRVKGLLLAVTTLAFAVFCASWLLNLDILDGGRPSIKVPRTIEAGIDFSSQRTFYWLCLVVLAVVMTVAARIRRRGVGRRLIAVRENDTAAASMTISPARTKLFAFALGGAFAALAGALYGGVLGRLDTTAFAPETSVKVVAIAVIGGLGSVTGAVIGAIWVVGLPALLGDSPEVSLATSGIGLLVLLMYFPGGLIELVHRLREVVYRRIVARAPEPPAADRSTMPARPASSDRPMVVGPALEVSDVTVRFGGTTAVDNMALTVAAGEIVGLIGANGAGKTTLMNAIGGYVPSTGAVRLFGTELHGSSPAQRARHGLARSFQNAELFADLTVRETVQVALEARHRTSVAATLIGTPGSLRRERAQARDADELISFLGLGRYANSVIGNLSTGTRRITELACILALDARVVCLDEPTAGVAQKETEAFGPLIRQLRREFDLSILVIEHDMPLVMAISDRVYCMASGRAIATGTPDEVRNDPAVIASYLGTDERAIMRSTQ